MGFGYSGGIENHYDEHSLPLEGKPNSKCNLYKNGELRQSRWYNSLGKPIWNRDYTDHGYPQKHPIVPHDHIWAPDRQKDSPPDYNWR